MMQVYAFAARLGRHVRASAILVCFVCRWQLRNIALQDALFLALFLLFIHRAMNDFSPSDLKTILHSKRANLYYLEHCRVLVNGGRVEYVTDELVVTTHQAGVCR